MSSSPARLDPRIRRTRQAIQDAFGSLLSERGLAPLTVQDIAAQAGVNRATFYAHYRDKHDLFRQLIRDHLEATLTAHLSRPFGLDPAGLKTLLRAVCTFMVQVHEGCHVHDDEMEVQIEQQVQRQLTGWLLEGLNASTQAPNSRVISRETTAALTASCLYAAAATWARGGAEPPLETHLSEALVFISGGVAATGFHRYAPAPTDSSGHWVP